MGDGKTNMKVNDGTHERFVKAKPDGVTHDWFLRKLLDEYEGADD